VGPLAFKLLLELLVIEFRWGELTPIDERRAAFSMLLR
jgi:hypothetical protein